MKNLSFVTFLFAFVLTAHSFAAQEQKASAEETRSVLSALSKPANPTATMLLAALSGANKSGLNIESNEAVVTKMGSNSYQVVLTVGRNGYSEYSTVSIEEVSVRNGQAYVFNFSVFRAVKMNKYPGVSMGNR